MSGSSNPASSYRKLVQSSIPAKFKKYYSISSSLRDSFGLESVLVPNSKSHLLRPSELSKASIVNPDDYPQIGIFVIKYVNSFIHLITKLFIWSLVDYGKPMISSVNVDTPLFQASPTVITFQDYAPFAVHEKKLYFRNNDNVQHAEK